MSELAKAEKTTETRVKKVEENVPVVKLTLELDEAKALYAVLRNVGGPHDKRRGKISNVSAALAHAGVYADGVIGVRGSIFLDDNSSSVSIPRNPYAVSFA